MDRLADLTAEFRRVHERRPTPLEMINLRIAARLAAISESPRTPRTERVRAGNTLARHLRMLNLATPPVRPRPSRPLVAQYLAQTQKAPPHGS
jgi:hypothetical protein